MKNPTIIVIVVAMGLLALGMAACGHRSFHPSAGRMPDVEHITGKIKSRLDLTDAQEQDLSAMVEAFRARAETLRADRANTRQQVAALVRGATIDRGEADRLLAAKREKLGEMVDFAMDRFIRFHATLTPEQREKLAHGIESHSGEKCRFGHRFGPG